MSRNKFAWVTCPAWRASRLNRPKRFWTAFRQASMKLNRKSWPKLVRGLLSLSVLMGICAMLFPLPIAPLPQNLQEKDSSEPFPCQNRPCGCRSADQCWKKCCCFDNNQKIAWAKANNVKVPDFVLAAAKKETEGSTCSGRAGDVNSLMTTQAKNQSGDSRFSLAISDRKSAAAKSAGCCVHCAKKPVAVTKPSCCQKAADPVGDTSIAAKPGSCESCVVPAKKSNEVQPKRSNPSKSKWVLAVFAAECQGQGPPAFCFPTSIIPERIALVMPTVAVIETIPLESERLQQTSLRPPLPPPKIV